MPSPLTREHLEAAHAWWDEVDRVPGRPGMTEFRRALRYHQSRWRETRGYPIGTNPILPKDGKPVQPVGSRLPLQFAMETGVNFITTGAREAVRWRTSQTEAHQSFDRQRLWADLLWSPSLAFNLFGDLMFDLDRADHAVHRWWPDTPGTVTEVRFAHSPGRLDPSYIGSLVDFDAAFVLDLGEGDLGLVAVDVKYHDRIQRELPKPARLPRYLEVTEQSGVFESGAVEAVNGTKLLVMWLEHLLLLSTLQHPAGGWRWGRYVVAHPAGNLDFAAACGEYGALLRDGDTFTAVTLEALLGSDALPQRTASALRGRYLPRRLPSSLH